MGNSKKTNRRQGIHLPRPSEQLNDPKKKKKQQQKQAQEKDAKLAINVLCQTVVTLDVEVEEREVKRASENIMQSIKKSMYVLPNLKCKKSVMLKVFSSPWIFELVLEIVGKETSKLVVAQKEVIRGLMKSLNEVKMPLKVKKLATKHVLLIAAISFREFLFMVRVWICKL